MEDSFPWTRGGEVKGGWFQAHYSYCALYFYLASLVAQMVKNLPAMQEMGSVLGWGRSLGEGDGNPL